MPWRHSFFGFAGPVDGARGELTQRRVPLFPVSTQKRRPEAGCKKAPRFGAARGEVRGLRGAARATRRCDSAAQSFIPRLNTKKAPRQPQDHVLWLAPGPRALSRLAVPRLPARVDPLVVRLKRGQTGQSTSDEHSHWRAPSASAFFFHGAGGCARYAQSVFFSPSGKPGLRRPSTMRAGRALKIGLSDVRLAKSA
jgi:hypothetical protein